MQRLEEEGGEAEVEEEIVLYRRCFDSQQEPKSVAIALSIVPRSQEAVKFRHLDLQTAAGISR